MFQLTHYTVNPYAIPPAVAGLASVGLGLLVLWRERRSAANVLFGVVTLTISGWLVAFSLMYCARDEPAAFWWAKAAYLSVPLIPSAIYHFTVAVLGIYPRCCKLVWLSWMFSALFSAAILGTNALIRGLSHYWWGYYPRYGALSIPYLTFFFGMMVLSLREFWLEYRKAPPGSAHQHRVKALMVAFAIVYTASFDYLAKYGIPLYPFGYLPVFAFLILTARIIWRYHLVDLTPAFAANQILETMNGAVLVVDLEGRIQVINRATAELLGYQVAELLRTPLATILEPPDGSGSPAEAAAGPGTIREREMIWRTKEGRRVHVSVSASPVIDQGRQVGVVYVGMDVTDRKRAEEALRKTARELESSEEALRKQTKILHSMLQSIGDGVVIADAQGKFLLFNPAAERILGIGSTETGPEQWSQTYGVLFPDTLTPVPAQEFPLLRAIHGEAVSDVELLIRNPNVPDGVYISVTGSPLRDEQGALKGGVVVFRDITERKGAESQLKQANTQLTQSQQALLTVYRDLERSLDELKATQLQLIEVEKMETVGRLAAGVAHEVKNPLATILMGVEYLVKHLSADGHNVTGVLDDMHTAVKRADSVIRGLLDFSAVKTLDLKVEHLHDIIEQSLSLVKLEMTKAHITVVKVLDEHLPSLKLDRTKIEQAFVNLFLNAIHAMPQGGTLTLTTAVRPVPMRSPEVGSRNSDRFRIGEPAVIVEVDDTGTGIPPEQLAKVFDPFFTTKPTGKGTGLGLTVTQNIMELHNGLIMLANRPEGGVRATLLFKMLERR